jgi:AcrR family transcriptional regulator
MITDIAIDEFAENAYENVSISRIVERAGIAKGSFYQYFEDKRDLYLYLFEIIMQEKNAFFTQTPPPDPAMNVFEHLRWLGRAGASFEFSNPRLAKIGYRVLSEDVPLPEEMLEVARRGGRLYFQQFVEQGIAQGVIDPEVDQEVAAFLFDMIVTHYGKVMMERLGIDPDSLAGGERYPLDTPEGEALFDNLVHILQHGLGVRQLDKTPRAYPHKENTT